MKKRQLVRIYLALALILLGLSLIYPAYGDINGDIWIETWASSPQFDYSGDPETMVTSLEILDQMIGGTIFQFGMAVCVYQYQPHFQDYNEVNFRISTYFESTAIAPYRPVQATEVILFIEKVGPSYHYDDQRIKFVVDYDMPYVSGTNLEPCYVTKARSDAIAQEIEGLAHTALSMAVNYCIPFGGVAVDFVVGWLISHAYKIDTSGSAYDNAGWSSGDTQAHFGWSQNADIGPWSQNCPDYIRQSTFNCLEWYQKKNVNPVYPMGIKVYAKLKIDGPNVGCFDSCWYDTRDYPGGTKYLYIGHKDYNLPPGIEP
ncbi:MAG: hypothetical protein ACFFC6_00590 [Promethearchaeota archaeon]